MLKVENINKIFGNLNVIDKLTFDVNKGEIVVIIGPSGCGKTTILNIISGLQAPSSGKIIFDDDIVINIGYAFQKSVLLPWLTLKKNIFLPFKLKDKEVDNSIIENYNFLMKEVNLLDYENYYPKEVSGGMKARSVLVRNLLFAPQLILMDEPFSSLDEISRVKTQNLFKKMLEKFETSVVFVTHSIEEALNIGDRLIILSNKPAKILYEIQLDSKSKSDLVKRQSIKDKILELL
ncbi:MAG: ABC transporter ATP-binding protein [Chitinophagales bacterium]